ncbi:MAG: HPr(Ser) kinase/phosphatase [Gammaproteobacteria bacterium]|nr:HPr(Ser) kinase/phosphatase [Gammaproteobacteria bacterium]
MQTTVTAQLIFDTFGDSLKMNWTAGKTGADRIFLDSRDSHHPTANLIGFLNIIHPPMIQVIGQQESAHLDGLGKNSLQDTIDSLFHHSSMIIISQGGALPAAALKQAEREQVPVVTTAEAGDEVISRLRYYLTRITARHESLHGVFLEVLGVGILLTGHSGIGKSELALELISRGHRLIADDAPIFTRTAPDVLNGSCPQVLCGFLEVRGLGILNIPAMFGDNALKSDKNLRLIIDLQPADSFVASENDRLYGSVQTREIMEVKIPQLTLPVAPGRSLAVLVEGAVRNHLLRLRGYNAADAFIEQQQQLLDTQSE